MFKSLQFGIGSAALLCATLPSGAEPALVRIETIPVRSLEELKGRYVRTTHGIEIYTFLKDACLHSYSRPEVRKSMGTPTEGLGNEDGTVDLSPLVVSAWKPTERGIVAVEPSAVLPRGGYFAKVRWAEFEGVWMLASAADEVPAALPLAEIHLRVHRRAYDSPPAGPVAAVVTRPEDFPGYLGRRITVVGEVSNAKIPNILGLQVELGDHDLRGQVAEATGVVIRYEVEKSDSAVPFASLGPGIYYALQSEVGPGFAKAQARK